MSLLGSIPDIAFGSTTFKVKEDLSLQEAFPEGTYHEGEFNLSGVVIKTEVLSDSEENVSFSRLAGDDGLHDSRNELTDDVSQEVNVDPGKRTSDRLGSSDGGEYLHSQHTAQAIKIEESNEEDVEISRPSSYSETPVIKTESTEASKGNITWDIVPIRKVEPESQPILDRIIIYPFVSKRSMRKKQEMSTRRDFDDDFNFETILLKEENESLSEKIMLEDFVAEESNPLASTEEPVAICPPKDTVRILVRNEGSLNKRMIGMTDGIEEQCELTPNFVDHFLATDESNNSKPKRKKSNKRRPQFCPICGAKFTQKHNLIYHLRTHTGEKPFECEKCPSKFRNKDGLKFHVLRVHTNIRPYPCTLCEKSFCRSDLLKSHMRTHTGEKLFLCEFCPARFSRSDKLKDHLLRHNPERAEQIFTCAFCPAEFFRKDKLKAHLRVHSDDRPFACSQCPHTFRRADALKSHMKLHSSATPFACTLCSAKYQRKHFLKMHVQVHGDNALFKCEHCSGKFKTKKSLLNHFKDSECSPEFRRTGALRSHRHLHSCSLCPAKFTKKLHLELHLHSMAHTKKEMFCCAHCPAKFSSKWTLAVHLRVHSNNYPHPCPHCSAKFKQSHGLTRHLQLHPK